MNFNWFHKSRRPQKAVFQGFWHGPEPGELNLACLKSFLDLGYKFELYTYEDFSLPYGIVLKDAGEIIPLRDVFYFDNPESNSKDLGPFSDLFRFKLLYERGGWWVDVDTICLSKDIPIVKRAWAQESPEVNPSFISGGQLCLGKGDPLANELYLRCLETSQTAFKSREALGPRLLSAVIKEKNLPPNIFGDPETFFPVRFIEMYKLWMPEFLYEVEEKTKHAMFLPIYQSFPRSIGLVSSRLPPSGSYLGNFCSKFVTDYEARSKYSADEIRNGTRDYLERNSKWAIGELRAVSGEAALKELGF